MDGLDTMSGLRYLAQNEQINKNEHSAIISLQAGGSEAPDGRVRLTLAKGVAILSPRPLTVEAKMQPIVL
ncbi:MAG TPA: hypothetical protein VLQ93_02115, partial [Myxococcaceae bacterium]|nr:hypothetical protein [Myxococcaceae bacterium]